MKTLLIILLSILFASCSMNKIAEKGVSKILDLENEYIYDVAYSPDMQKQSYVIEDDNSDYSIVENGIKSGNYDDIVLESLKYSADSKHFAFVANNNEKVFVVIDGLEQKKYDGVYENTLIFSDDSQSYSYVAFNYIEGTDQGESIEYLVKDVTEIEEAYDFNSISYFPGTTHLNYIVTKTLDDYSSLVIQDVMQNIDYNEIEFLRISKDGKDIFYVAYNDESEKYILVKNGEEVVNSSYDAYYELFISDDGSNVYASVFDEDYNFILRNNSRVSEQFEEEIYMLSVADDFEKFAFTFESGEGKEVVYFNGNKSKEYDNVYNVLFSPDSQHFAYDVEDGDEKYYSYLNGKRLDGYTDFPYFTPDSKKLIYIQGGKDNKNSIKSIDL